MSYNGSGTFVVNSSGQPVVTGTVISSTAFNALTADLATGLSTAITKDGQTTTTSRILFAQGISSTLVTDATSATTGSIITAGGISTQKALWVGTTSNFAGAMTVSGSAGPQATITTSASGSYGLFRVINTNTNGEVSIGYRDSSDSDTTSWVVGKSVGSVADNFGFYYNGLKAMFDTSGYLLVGTSSPATSSTNTIQATVGSTATFTSTNNGSAGSGCWTYRSLLPSNTTADTTGYHFEGSNSGTSVIQIITNGNIKNQNNSYGAISDLKVKQDIVLAASQWADIKAIGQIVKKYHLKSNPEGPLQIGLIAQDLQLISPGLVFSTPDLTANAGDLETGTLGVNYSVLYMKAVKALGEALERIETLETRLAALENK